MQTFTVPSALRGGSQTPVVLGPFAVPPNTTEIQVGSIMATADILSTNPVYTIDFAVEIDYGKGWPATPDDSTHWTSGPNNTNPRGTHGPGLNVAVAPTATQVRASLVIPTAVSIGATVTVLP